MKNAIWNTTIIGFMLFIGFNSFATKWVNNGMQENVNGCIITYQTCERKFLSFDGCNVGGQRAVFDSTSAECQAFLETEF